MTLCLASRHCQRRPRRRREARQRDRHRRIAANCLDEPHELLTLAFVHGAPSPLYSSPAPSPDLRESKVVEPRCPSACGDFEDLLRIPRVSISGVGDRRDRAIVESQLDLKVVRVLGGHREHFGWPSAKPPAERVDEMPTLTGEPGTLELLVAVPAW